MPRPSHARETDILGSAQSQMTTGTSNPPGTDNATYGDHSSTYWSPGWNYERLINASVQELHDLPDGELDKMRSGLREVLGEDGLQQFTEHMYQHELKRTSRTAPADTDIDNSSPPSYGDSSSTYWTPDWDYARFTSSTATDLYTLPPGELEKMQAGLKEGLGEAAYAQWACQMWQKWKDNPAAPFIVQTLTGILIPDFVSLWLNRCGAGAWGFVAMRTACYEDEERWRAFKDRVMSIAALNFEREKGKPGVDDAVAKFNIHWIEDADLDGADDEKLREVYRDLDDTVPWGQRHSVFLNMNSTAIASILSSAPPTLSSKYWRADAPFLLAVAAELPAPADPEDEEDAAHEENEWLRPSFRVAAEALTGEFWTVIAGDFMPLRRVTRCLESVDEVWWSMNPSPERYAQRRARRAELGDGLAS